MPSRRTIATLCALTALLVGCATTPPDRTAQAHALTAEISALPGVESANSDVAHNQAQGMVFFRLYVDVADDLTAEQAGDITTHYLHGLDSGRYDGYRLELDLRRGWNVFAVDSGQLPVTNPAQVVSQARDWVAVRHEFPGATVRIRASITHPGGAHPDQDAGHANIGKLQLADPAAYPAVSAAARTLANHFPQLAVLDWTINAGRDHPAEIKTTQRMPTAAELAVFNRLNADQTIPHIDRLRINGPVTPPVWFSEQTTESRDVAVALQLAQAHLPVVATLPHPVLYTASDELSGHIGGLGLARGPVAVTIGGCTRHDPAVYLPIPQERALIARYESCSS